MSARCCFQSPIARRRLVITGSWALARCWQFASVAVIFASAPLALPQEASRPSSYARDRVGVALLVARALEPGRLEDRLPLRDRDVAPRPPAVPRRRGRTSGRSRSAPAPAPRPRPGPAPGSPSCACTAGRAGLAWSSRVGVADGVAVAGGVASHGAGGWARLGGGSMDVASPPGRVAVLRVIPARTASTATDAAGEQCDNDQRAAVPARANDAASPYVPVPQSPTPELVQNGRYNLPNISVTTNHPGFAATWSRDVGRSLRRAGRRTRRPVRCGPLSPARRRGAASSSSVGQPELRRPGWPKVEASSRSAHVVGPPGQVVRGRRSTRPTRTR